MELATAISMIRPSASLTMNQRIGWVSEHNRDRLESMVLRMLCFFRDFIHWDGKTIVENITYRFLKNPISVFSIHMGYPRAIYGISRDCGNAKMHSVALSAWMTCVKYPVYVIATALGFEYPILPIKLDE